jgi:hypothetical protein
MAKNLLTKSNKKVSLNIKISESLDLKLKVARKLAREQNMIFNVSKEVEDFLSKKVEKALRELGVENVGDAHSQLEF